MRLIEAAYLILTGMNVAAGPRLAAAVTNAGVLICPIVGWVINTVTQVELVSLAG